MFFSIHSNPCRLFFLASAVLVLVFALFMPGAKAESETRSLECRKTCVEQQCAPEYQTCMTKTLGSPQSCRTMRQDCETSCQSAACQI